MATFQVTSTIVTDTGTYQPGDIIELDDDVAASYVVLDVGEIIG